MYPAEKIPTYNDLILWRMQMLRDALIDDSSMLHALMSHLCQLPMWPKMRQRSKYSAIVILQVIVPFVNPFIVINGQVRGNMRNYSPNTPHFPTMQPGLCADPSPVRNFKMDRFRGAWYVQKQTPSAFQTPDQTCAR